MAKIKLGAIVVDMRGKLGGHVFAQNKGGNYVRTKVTPVNPQTTAQTSVRAIFGNISQNWSALTQAGRDSFNSLVSAYAKTNVFGDLKNPTGKALYQRLNQNLAISNQTMIDTAVNPLVLVANQIESVNATADDQAIGMDCLGDATGNKVLVFATPPMSAGTLFVKNKLRLIAAKNGVSNGTIACGSDYTNKFGAFAMGDNIVFAIKTINANGQASPLQTKKVEILAT